MGRPSDIYFGSLYRVLTPKNKANFRPFIHMERRFVANYFVVSFVKYKYLVLCITQKLRCFGSQEFHLTSSVHSFSECTTRGLSEIKEASLVGKHTFLSLHAAADQPSPDKTDSSMDGSMDGVESDSRCFRVKYQKDWWRSLKLQ